MLQPTQKFNLLSGIAKTKYISFPLPVTLNQGIAIGIGKCRAVILRLNQYTRNSTTGAVQAVEQIYYGDDQNQEFELLRGINSEIIFCEDLQQVWVRAAEDCTLQVLIYY